MRKEINLTKLSLVSEFQDSGVGSMIPHLQPQRVRCIEDLGKRRSRMERERQRQRLQRRQRRQRRQRWQRAPVDESGWKARGLAEGQGSSGTGAGSSPDNAGQESSCILIYFG